MRLWKIIWEWKLWQLNLKIEILENYLRIEALTIKFENWDFGKLFEKEALTIKFENWDFGKLFDNGSFDN